MMVPLLFAHDLFRKPVPTPHQVRGKLFRDHALVPLKTWVFTAARDVISTDVARLLA